jgi:hypothetical protein
MCDDSLWSDYDHEYDPYEDESARSERATAIYKRALDDACESAAIQLAESLKRVVAR